ncbi:MAG TPA: hypothetical protein VND93_20225, partial [Myxococcales bacterium]|nr:hypothetical protein [Myxococcales bacterium]
MRAMLIGGLLALALSRAAAAAGNCKGPAPGAWMALPAQDAPGVTSETPVVWTGRKLLVFGTPGAVFDPCSNRWRRMSMAGLPLEAWGSHRLGPYVTSKHVVFLLAGNRGEVPYVQSGVMAFVYDVAAGR